MAPLQLAADGDGSFWPHGVIMILVITVITWSAGTWRDRRLKKGKKS
ncbi:hypothetical protein ACIPWL_14865 [Streptomyces sp. NPDC090023]